MLTFQDKPYNQLITVDNTFNKINPHRNVGVFYVQKLMQTGRSQILFGSSYTETPSQTLFTVAR